MSFISYSRHDLTLEKWLQKKLETFQFPADMRGDRPRRQKLRIFRDQTDLGSTGWGFSEHPDSIPELSGQLFF